MSDNVSAAVAQFAQGTVPEVSASDTFANGWYNARVAAARPSSVTVENVEKMTVEVEFRFLDQDVTGQPLTETFWIGTDDDPTVADPATWDQPRGGGRKLAALCAAVGMMLGGQPLATTLAMLTDKQLMVRIGHNKAEDRNRVYSFAAPGTRQTSRDTAAPSMGRPVAAALQQAPAPGAYPNGMMATQAAPQAAPAPTMPSPLPAAPVPGQ